MLDRLAIIIPPYINSKNEINGDEISRIIKLTFEVKLLENIFLIAKSNISPITQNIKK